MSGSSLLLAIKIFVRYSRSCKLLFLFSSFLNLASSVLDVLVVTILPIFVHNTLNSSEINVSPLSTLPSVFVDFITPITYLILIIASLISKNLSIHFSTKYSAYISRAYLQDFSQSFYSQNIDGIRKIPKEDLSCYIQTNFPLIGREIFYPATQLVSSSIFITLLLLTSIRIDNYILIIFLGIMILSYSAVSLIVNKKLTFLGSKVRQIIFDQGTLVGLLHNSSLDSIFSTKPYAYSNAICKNDSLLKKIQGKSVIYTGLPKIFTESVMLCSIVIISALSTSHSSILILSPSALVGNLFILFKLLSAVQVFSRSFFLLKTNKQILVAIEDSLKSFKCNSVPEYIEVCNSNTSPFLLEAYQLRINSSSLAKIFNFQIREGDICLLDGPSGIGKTRLLYTLSGRLRPLEGKIILNSISGDTKSLPFLLSQKQQIILGNVCDIISYGTSEQTKERLIQLEQEYNVRVSTFTSGIATDSAFESFLKFPSRKLSGGQLQQVLLLRSIIHSNSLIFLDEPTSNMDHHLEAACMNELVCFVQSMHNSALVYTTHSQDIKKLSSKIITLF